MKKASAKLDGRQDDSRAKKVIRINNVLQEESPYYDPSFSESVINWQKQHGRHSLPWQQTNDAYRVWLSEIMLQQTQVTTVIPYYQRFLDSFPTVHELAAAPSEQVMALWAGLGYYTRARNLHHCAKQVVQKYQGNFPSDPVLLQELPGIGRSTAAAVTAFSYGTLAAILDGNVKRVFARVFGIEGFPGAKPVEDDLWLRANALLPKQDIQSYTQGLMDLGATLCTRSSPACQRCPLQQTCIAHKTHRTAELPVRKPKREQKEKHTVLLVLEHEGEILLEQRPDSGIWGGLLSLPELDGMREGNGKTPAPDLFQTDVATHLLADPRLMSLDEQVLNSVRRFGDVAWSTDLPELTHGFTHFKLYIRPLHFRLSQRLHFIAEKNVAWYPLTQIEQAALPAPVKTLLLSLRIR
ncbi:A/G-specific adenine glycosylase [Undibacterium sp. Di24W]|uniref:A/G-specific adenine glycosylase n=1 Tax=Undibacterium sp. Di24W TaxID=3413033 RepID=UPI003BEFDB38